jgi:hypothetical protein
MIWEAKVTKVYELIQMPVQACAGMILLGRNHYICVRTSHEYNINQSLRFKIIMNCLYEY